MDEQMSGSVHKQGEQEGLECALAFQIMKGTPEGLGPLTDPQFSRGTVLSNGSAPAPDLSPA